MAEEGRGVALAILGVVAVIAVVGLVLLFKGAGTGGYVAPFNKLYGGGEFRDDPEPLRFVKSPVPEQEVPVYYSKRKGYDPQFGNPCRDIGMPTAVPTLSATAAETYNLAGRGCVEVEYRGGAAFCCPSGFEAA